MDEEAKMECNWPDLLELGIYGIKTNVELYLATLELAIATELIKNGCEPTQKFLIGFDMLNRHFEPKFDLYDYQGTFSRLNDFMTIVEKSLGL